MKIALHLRENYNESGLKQTYIKGLYSGLLNNQHEPRIITHNQNAIDEVAVKVFHTSAVTQRLDSSELSAYFKLERFQVLHVITPVGITGNQLLGQSNCVNVATILTPNITFTNFLAENLATKTTVNKILGFVAPTAKLAMDFEKKYGGKARVISFGVDTAKYESARGQAEKNVLKSQLGLPEDNLATILYHNNLDSNSGIMDLIRTFEALTEITRSARLIVAGSGPMERKARTYIKENKIRNVRFIGRISEARAPLFYKAVDLFCTTAASDQLALNLLRAFSSGLPVVAFDNPSYKEILEKENREFLVGQGQHKALAHKLHSLITDRHRRIRLGERNRTIATERYSWDSVSKKMVDFYRSLQQSAIY